jgi:hypothetical protein
MDDFVRFTYRAPIVFVAFDFLNVNALTYSSLALASSNASLPQSPRRTSNTPKRFAALMAVVVLVGALFLPTVASAQSEAPSSIIVKLVAGLTDQEKVDLIATNGGILRSAIPALGLYVIDVAAAELPDTLARYQADPRVQRAEPNKVRVSESVPGDPLYANQWALPKIAWEQVFGTVDPTGTAIVAVLDTGVDARHPELAGKLVSGTSILDGGNGTTDASGHGTWLAGIIAAQTGGPSPDGIVGVAYDGVLIMPVTVLSANGEGLDSDVIAGVVWATDNGANVILMAFSNPGFSPALQEAIDYAWSRGVVLVASAGNNASSTPAFPAGDRSVMGVTATDENDAQAYFSNEGQAVFIAAPGTDIQTIDLGDAYTVISGTSAAAAHVAGLAAFMKAVDPTLPNGVIVFRIASTADPAGTQTETGNGRINMARALASTATDSIRPAGAAPVGEGGPFVGPYTADNVSALTLVSPTSGSPVTITSLPATVNVSFTYSSTATSATTGVARVVQGATTIGSSGLQTLVSGTSQSATLSVAIPSGTVNGNYRVEVTVTNNTQPPGPTSRQDGQNNAIAVNVPSDVTPPTVTINQAAGQADPTKTSPINFTVIFSEPVTGFTGTDVTIGGTAGGTKTATVTGGPTTFNVAVTGMTTSGTVTASIAAGVAADAASNANEASTSTDNTVTWDVTPPTVTINQAAGQADPTNLSPINFTVIFSEPVTGFTDADVTIGGTAGGTKTKTLTGGPTTFNLAVSGVTDGTVVAGIASGVATDLAGNGNEASTSTDNMVTFDATPPLIAVSFTPNGLNGWFVTSPAAGTVTVTDPSKVVAISCVNAAVGTITGLNTTSATAPLNVTAEGTHGVSCTAKDSLGNDGAAPGSTNTATVMIDVTPPTITLFSRTPAANAFGWNNVDVTVTWTCTDATSGPVAASVNQTVSSEGLNQSTTGICTDRAGHTASLVQGEISIDKTPPTNVTFVGGPAADGSYYFGFVPAAPTCTAEDALSGFKDCVISGYGTTVGTHTMTATAADKAFNTATAPRSYYVRAWTLIGFHSPVDMEAYVVNTVKGGSTVPVKFEVFAGPTELTDVAFIGAKLTTQATYCTGGLIEDPIEAVATGGTTLRYDWTGGQFIFNWQTPRSPGACYNVTLITADGSSLTAKFRLK